MWKNKNKQVPDERILKETNRLGAKMYIAMWVLSLLFLIVKLVYRLPWFMFAVEAVALLICGLYVVIRERKMGILFLKDKDDALKNLQAEIWAKASNIMLEIISTGELILLFVAEEYLLWIVLYLVISLIPSLIYTNVVIKRGFFIWGNKKREKEGKKNFKIRVIIGSAFFGLITGFPMLFVNGSFQPTGFLWIIGMGAGWGIMFYFAMIGMMKLSEKKADQDLDEMENGYEE